MKVEEERKTPSPLPSPLRTPFTSPTITPITIAPTIIVIHAINGDRVEVPTRLPIETTSPSPTNTSVPISIIETTISTSTEPAHTTPGPQLVSTIPKKSTIGAPLTTTTLTTDTLTEQEIQRVEIAGTSQPARQESIDEAHGFQEPSNLYEAAQMAQLYMNHMLSKA